MQCSQLVSFDPSCSGISGLQVNTNTFVILDNNENSRCDFFASYKVQVLSGFFSCYIITRTYDKIICQIFVILCSMSSTCLKTLYHISQAFLVSASVS